jgi:DNA-binding response OmpR family regulator
LLIMKTILLVEDEAVIALNKKMILEKHGHFKVIIAHDGAKALETIKYLPIALVLMDIQLRGELGSDVAREILKLDDSVPILFMSAYDESMVKSYVGDIPYYGYISKNMTDNSFLAVVDNALKLYNATRMYHDIFDQSASGLCICMVSRDRYAKIPFCEVLRANKAFIRMFGTLRDRMTLQEVFKEDSEEILSKISRMQYTSKPTIYTTKLRSFQKQFEISIFPLNTKNELILAFHEEHQCAMPLDREDTYMQLISALQTMLSFLSLKASLTPESKDALLEAGSSIISMIAIFEETRSNEDVSSLSVTRFMESFMAGSLNLFHASFEKVPAMNVDNFELSAQQLILLGIILSELLSKSYSKLEIGELNISLLKKEDKALLIYGDTSIESFIIDALNVTEYLLEPLSAKAFSSPGQYILEFPLKSS